MVRCAFWCDLVIMSKPGFSKKRGEWPRRGECNEGDLQSSVVFIITNIR